MTAIMKNAAPLVCKKKNKKPITNILMCYKHQQTTGNQFPISPISARVSLL